MYSCRIFLSLLIITFTPGKCHIKTLTTSTDREEKIYLNMILVPPSRCVYTRNPVYGTFMISRCYQSDNDSKWISQNILNVDISCYLGIIIKKHNDLKIPCLDFLKVYKTKQAVLLYFFGLMGKYQWCFERFWSIKPENLYFVFVVKTDWRTKRGRVTILK